MKQFILYLFILICLGTSIAIAEETKTVETESPVKVEMRVLNNAFINLINSLIFNNPKAIEGPFHEVHKAKIVTEEALKKGRLKLPKNSNKIKQFVEMDERFHKDMEVMLEASRRGDMKKVQDMTHKLLNGCVQCHKMFRN